MHNLYFIMGNCSLKGVAEENYSNNIKILTDSGGITEYKTPIAVKDILVNHPGYGIFRQGQASMPMNEQEVLVAGRVYYLLPLDVDESNEQKVTKKDKKQGESKKQEQLEVDKIDASEYESCKEEQPKVDESEVDRVSSGRSSDFVKSLAEGRDMEVLSTSGDGVWKVKLVINTKQLEEILAEDVNTEALIEKMRMAAAVNALTPKRMKSFWSLRWNKSALNGLFRIPSESGDRKLKQKG